ncbi:MAG: sigma-54-dependent Fis family transcriptional regulator [Acidobacteria bacterium]|nr:MAG: sigma-54-dependent Fis family transcriptional regulator [Acidobacteriota bacterium]
MSSRSNTKGTVLIVDDETYVRDSLATVMRRKGYMVRTAPGADQLLASGALQGVDVVVTDLRMPGQDGLAFLRSLAETESTVPVIVLTGHGTVPSAVECMKAGAFDYLLKPSTPDELDLTIERALNQTTMKRELDYFRSTEVRRPGPSGPVGVSTGWKQVLRLVEATAPADTTVLLLGESGTGKGEVARLVHQYSRRAKKPFVRVNCAAIPIDLFESEFFGHRRGSFTGATSDREGRFRVAHQGTLFMDEITSMPAAAQAKVLRVLEDGVFERVGDSHPTSVDVRLVAACNVDLQAEVDAGRFRQDLFYRINVMTVHIPPLRERREDIPVLAESFLEEFRARLARPVQSFHPETMKVLECYHWPGNVRELRNVIERAVLLETGAQLMPTSLPFGFQQQGVSTTDPEPQDLNLRSALAAEERRILKAALVESNGVRREAARLLGIDERNLSYFLKKHGLAGTGARA